MAEQISIALPDGSPIKPAEWDALVSAGLHDQQLRILRHQDKQRLLIHGRVGDRKQSELLTTPNRGDIEGCLVQLCEKLELPLELVHSCMRRLPEGR